MMSYMAKILLVEDEPDFSVLISQFLASEHHTVEVAASGEAALDLLAVYHFDCLILDWNLPGLSGLEVCQRYRATKGSAPILMLTARQHVDDKSAGLDSGADDYLTKPFELKEFSSRVRALLRRPTSFAGTRLTAGAFEMDVNNFKLTRQGREVSLMPKEFALFEFFMRHPNQVFSPETLIDRVWASDQEASPETIRTYIKRLRKKLDVEGKPSSLSTIHGVGYKFEPTDPTGS